MSIASTFYDLAYRGGNPRWDTDAPTEEVAEAADRRRPGRALDLGCGTGSNCLFLARQGWSVTGVDFSPAAIEAANGRAARADVACRFVRGGVTRLSEAELDGPYELVIDVGCFHGLPRAAQDRYARSVAALTRPGPELLIVGVQRPPLAWRLIGAAGAPRSTVVDAFGAGFELVAERARTGTPAMAAYRLVRTAEG
jgi:2-polyprenyl-3-methyl-5-hydroxy-6-metoxy-1,4-benzoquinol methylase